MKQFEINKTYKADNGIRIKTIKRTDKTLFFKYLDPNCGEDMEKIYRKRIKIENDCENINLGDWWSTPHVYAKDEII